MGRQTRPTEKVQEFYQGESEHDQGKGQGEPGGGVLHAIGETLVEIGQTTTGLLAGQGLSGQHPSYKQDESKEEEQKVHSFQGS